MHRPQRVSSASAIFAAACLIGCGKSDPGPAAPGPSPAPAPAPTPAPGPAADASPEPEPAPADCVPNEVADIIGGLDPELARLEGTSVELCGLVGDDRHCVVLDLETGLRTTLSVDDNDVKRLPDYPAGFDEGLLRDEKRPLLKLCLSAETGCRDLHAGQAIAGHFDAERNQVVITSWDEGMKRAKVYLTRTLELVHTLEIGPADLPDCSFAAFVKDKLVVSSGPCTGGGQSWLYDPTSPAGAKVADIGGETPLFIKDGQFVAVPAAGDNVFAFRAADGDTVVLQDVITGAVLARLDLREAVGDTTPKHDGAWILAHELGLVLVESRPLPNSVYLADPKTLEVKKVMLPRPCP